MTRTIDKELMSAWVASVGGPGKAVSMIMEVAGISNSMARKIVQANYRSVPQFLVRRAICDLAGLLEDSLFPVVSSSRNGKAS
jgi:hypothetical protein